MKLSVLLLAVASTCLAQIKPATPPAAPSLSQTQSIAVVDDQAIAHAAGAVAAAANMDHLQKMLDRVNRASCPVVLTSAWLAPHLMLVDTPRDSAANGLDLEFRNTSGKEIRLMQFSAKILVKKSKYDLDYLPPIRVYLTAEGTRTVDETFAQLRHLSLPEDIHPTLVQGITLEEVTFEDGSAWAPAGNQYCGLKPDPVLSIAR
jgi:hypothetical protein